MSRGQKVVVAAIILLGLGYLVIDVLAVVRNDNEPRENYYGQPVPAGLFSLIVAVVVVILGAYWVRRWIVRRRDPERYERMKLSEKKAAEATGNEGYDAWRNSPPRRWPWQ